MASPGKKGLDYFSFDTNFFQDIKVRKLIKNHGSQAIPIYTYLLCIIYREGYYIKWDEDLPFIIAEATGYEEDHVNKVFDYCLKIGLFSADLFRQKEILTSRGIQKRYLKIMTSLKRKVVVSEFSLISSEETQVNSEETSENSEVNPTIEEKRIKGKGIKGEEEGKNSPSSEVPDFVSDNRKKLGSDPPELRPPPLSLAEYEVVLSENRWLMETICMSEKITEEDFRKALKKFFADKRAISHQPKSEKDITQHFMNWVPKRVWVAEEKEKPTGKLMQSIKNTVSAAEEINKNGGFFTYSDLGDS